MKKYFNYVVMVVIMMTLCVGFSSCNDEENGNDVEESGNNDNGDNNGDNNGGNDGNNETIDLQPSGNLKITESTGKEFVVSYECGSVKSYYEPYTTYNGGNEAALNGGNCILFTPMSSGGEIEFFLLKEGAAKVPAQGSYEHRFKFYAYCEKLEKGEMLTIMGRDERLYYGYADGWGFGPAIGFGHTYGSYYEFDYGEGPDNSDNYYGKNHEGNLNYTGTIEIMDINEAICGEWEDRYYYLKWFRPGNITIKFSNVQIRNIRGHTLTIDGTIKLPYVLYIDVI